MIRQKLLISVFSLSLALCGVNGVAFANKQASEKELSSIQENLKKAEREKNASISLAQKEEKQLRSLQSKLIEIANEEKRIGQNMSDLEDQIEALQRQKNETNKILMEEKKHFSDLLLAVQRLSRTPPEAFLAKPGAPIDTARANLILKSTLPSIKKQSDIISGHLRELEETEVALTAKKENLSKLSITLKDKNKDLNKLVDERKDIYQNYLKESKEQASEIAKLSAQADSLKEILADIEKQERFIRALPTPSVKPNLMTEKPPAQKTSPHTKPVQKIAAVTVPRNIEAHLPTPGRILIGFGQKNEFGVTNKGITIQGRADATVTTPFSGVVRFSGPFKKHRNLLIIEHHDGSMSLIDGMDRTNVVVGQALISGEPVGTMRGAKNSPHSELYYELRKNGRPIDPMKRLSALAKAG